MIEHLAKQFSVKLLLGAGTVLDPAARTAILAGAQFVVGSALNPGTARLCNRCQVPYVPGAGTIREVIEAMECDANIIKVFRGEVPGIRQSGERTAKHNWCQLAASASRMSPPGSTPAWLPRE